jgi:hypothetical protein
MRLDMNVGIGLVCAAAGGFALGGVASGRVQKGLRVLAEAIKSFEQTMHARLVAIESAVRGAKL